MIYDRITDKLSPFNYIITIVIASSLGIAVAFGLGRLFIMLITVALFIIIILNLRSDPAEIYLNSILLSMLFPATIMLDEYRVGTITTLLVTFIFTYLILRRGYSYKRECDYEIHSRKMVLYACITVIPFFFPLSKLFGAPLLFKSSLGLLFIYFVNLMIFYILITSVQNRANFIKICNCLLLISFLAGLTVVFHYLNPSLATNIFNLLFADDNMYDSVTHFVRDGGIIQRSKGIFNDYELEAELAAIGFVFSCSLLFIKTKVRYYAAVMVPFFLIVIFLTGTRGALISLTGGLLYLLLCMLKSRMLSLVSLFRIVILFLFSFALSLSLSPVRSYFDRFLSTTLVGYMPDTRVYKWSIYWNEITQNVITGHGLHRHGLFDANVRFIVTGDAHSLYIGLLYAGGLLAFILFLNFIFMLHNTTTLSRLLKLGDRIDITFLCYAIGLKAAFVVFLIDQIKITYMRGINYQHYAWFIFGIMGVLSVLVNKYSKERLRPD